MTIIESCENCRHGRQVGYDEYDCESWLCTNPDSDHAWQSAVQDGYCERYEPRKECGTCRYCKLNLFNVWYSGYVCRNPACGECCGELVELADKACVNYEFCGKEE